MIERRSCELFLKILKTRTIGGPIQCVVSYRDQCAHKHTNMSLFSVFMCALISTRNYTLNWAAYARISVMRFLAIWGSNF